MVTNDVAFFEHVFHLGHENVDRVAFFIGQDVAFDIVQCPGVGTIVFCIRNLVPRFTTESTAIVGGGFGGGDRDDDVWFTSWN